jgi:hypothetical protein
VRVAGHAGRVYLDLANERWQAVEVDAEGWRLVDEPPVRFRRPKGVLPLPVPVKGVAIEDLRAFVNVAGEDDWHLLVGWLVQALRPQGPYPLLFFHGEQGCAKSTTARVLRALVDPSLAPLRSEPREPRDLMIAGTNAWAIALDNLSKLDEWLSDALCRLATGGGFSTRQLYTDDEEMIFDAMRPCILTSIEDLATRGDLLERGIIASLPAIPKNKRRTERTFWADFEQARPRILGVLLDAVSGAIAALPGVQLEELPRMADFASWATAVEKALGWPRGAFLQSYVGNQRDANELALEASVLAAPLRRFAEAHAPWSGSAADLLASLTPLAGEAAAKGKEWPKKANALSNRLRRLAPNLRATGLAITFERKPGGKRQRLITIALEEKVCESSSPSSQAETADMASPSGGGNCASEGGTAPANQDRPATAPASSHHRPIRPRRDDPCADRDDGGTILNGRHKTPNGMNANRLGEDGDDGNGWDDEKQAFSDDEVIDSEVV